MELYALVGFIVVIAVVCTLFDIPEKFQKLLYVLGAILVLAVVLAFFGFSFGGHLAVKS